MQSQGKHKPKEKDRLRMREPFEIGNFSIPPGEQRAIQIPIPNLYTSTALTLPVKVIHGKFTGPVFFISAAIHGDEINGVEIIRRLLNVKSLNRLKGTLIAIPVVNIFGFINQTRYLPDRRDLNRSFPGSEKGSLAARMAYLFLNEIVSKCTHGIDLHTGAIHRDNLPQVRAFLDDEITETMAHAFTSPVILNTQIVEGSLREASEKVGVSVIVYEAGEALRFDEVAIRAGVKGIISVMRELEMLPKLKRKSKITEPVVATSSVWIRASQSGILRSITPLGARVRKNDVLGIISDPFGEEEEEIKSVDNGIIIGKSNIPLANEGEALFHLARFKSPATAADNVEEFQQEHDPETDTKMPVEQPIF